MVSGAIAMALQAKYVYLLKKKRIKNVTLCVLVVQPIGYFKSKHFTNIKMNIHCIC